MRNPYWGNCAMVALLSVSLIFHAQNVCSRNPRVASAETQTQQKVTLGPQSHDVTISNPRIHRQASGIKCFK